MQMGSPGLPSPMPEFSSINSSTYYRESHPREREKRGPLRYFLGTLLIFIGRAIKAKDPGKGVCVASSPHARFFFFFLFFRAAMKPYHRGLLLEPMMSRRSFMLQILIFAAYASSGFSHSKHYKNKLPFYRLSFYYILDKYLKCVKKGYFISCILHWTRCDFNEMKIWEMTSFLKCPNQSMLYFGRFMLSSRPIPWHMPTNRSQ